MTTSNLPSLTENVSLAERTTFELGGPARFLVEVATEAELCSALDHARREGLAVMALGSGSNMLVSDTGFDGLVLAMKMRGMSSIERAGLVELTVAAGEPWDDVVAYACERGLAGLECLSGIPGLTGSTPIQNVGAYGQEVSDTIVRVRTVDRHTSTIRVHDAAECQFDYRSSIWKTQRRDELVLDVTFALKPGGLPTVHYAELGRAAAQAGAEADLKKLRDVVLLLRRSKSMVVDATDPNRRSAGSFFVNPIVSRTQAARVVEQALAHGIIGQAEEMPSWSLPHGVKLAAGWLIERAGFARGMRVGAVGLSSRHALALVHHGGGSAAELLDFARTIVDGVAERFGVRLRPEPVFVGFDSNVVRDFCGNHAES